MESDVLASLWHCASNDKKPLHTHCPDGKESWCDYKRDKANKTSTYKHSKGLPLDVSLQMKPVYARFSDKELLRKCLDGKTQNQNESFNGMIWQRVPKTVSVGSDAFQLRVYDAVAHFNIGNQGTIKVFEALGMKPGSFCLAGVNEADRCRVKKVEYKTVGTKRGEKCLGERENSKGTKMNISKMLISKSCFITLNSNLAKSSTLGKTSSFNICAKFVKFLGFHNCK